MANPANGLQSVSPAAVLGEIAAAVPVDCRDKIIVIGSLSVGYHYNDQLGNMGVRTKDADCVLSPRVEAIPSGVAIAERLFDANWTFKPKLGYPAPGSEATPKEELPLIRLCPPHEAEWFVELLTVPPSGDERSFHVTRLETRHGHFALPSFGFIALTTLNPLPTHLGLCVARPEMMALANLLEHPQIHPQLIEGTNTKRSNKDLGRVLAIARLAIARNEDALLEWPELWKDALQQSFPDEWRALAARVGQGVRALLASESDLEQALLTCVNGLLASQPPTLEQFRIAGQRLLQDAIEPMETEVGAGE